MLRLWKNCLVAVFCLWSKMCIAGGFAQGSSFIDFVVHSRRVVSTKLTQFLHSQKPATSRVVASKLSTQFTPSIVITNLLLKGPLWTFK